MENFNVENVVKLLAIYPLDLTHPDDDTKSRVRCEMKDGTVTDNGWMTEEEINYRYTSRSFEVERTFVRPASQTEMDTAIVGIDGVFEHIHCLCLQMKDEYNRVWVTEGPHEMITDNPDGTCTVHAEIVYVLDLSLAAADVEPFPDEMHESVQCWAKI